MLPATMLNQIITLFRLLKEKERAKSENKLRTLLHYLLKRLIARMNAISVDTSRVREPSLYCLYVPIYGSRVSWEESEYGHKVLIFIR